MNQTLTHHRLNLLKWHESLYDFREVLNDQWALAMLEQSQR